MGMNLRAKLIVIISVAAIFFNFSEVFGIERFPPPDFEPGTYTMPTPTKPPARAYYWEFIDMFLLVAVLSLASYFALRLRSRRHLFWLTLFSIFYFGFIRQGCVCPIGSIQNVTLALFNKYYAVPVSVMFFFLMPLVFTLFFGRTFCAAVCPLGAIQDIVVWKPIKIKPWIENALRIIPFVYLGLAVLFAATGSAFLICEYDPFISFYRLGGSVNMLMLGGIFLLVGMFVGRPYCRFFCPYGAILSLLSRISKWNVYLTGEDCVRCQICDVACPYGAIATPTPESQQPEKTPVNIGNVLALTLITVVVVVAGAAGGGKLSVAFSKMNRTVSLAERIAAEESGKFKDQTDETKAFRQKGGSIDELYSEALKVRDRFAFGGAIFGGFDGLVICLKLMGARFATQRSIYEPDRASCVACGRCYAYCPKEIIRVRNLQKLVQKK
jgi:polyferredoxin